MTEDELLKYYMDTKNLSSEIELLGRYKGIKYIFRHYTEYGSGDDKWLNVVTDNLLNTDSLLKYYEIPNKVKSDVFKSLNIGDVILTIDEYNNTTFYKKIDTELFIECDKKGHIERMALTETFFLFSREELIGLSIEIKKI